MHSLDLLRELGEVGFADAGRFGQLGGFVDGFGTEGVSKVVSMFLHENGGADRLCSFELVCSAFPPDISTKSTMPHSASHRTCSRPSSCESPPFAM